MAVLWATGAVCWREHSQTRRAYWEDKERGSDFFPTCPFTIFTLTRLLAAGKGNLWTTACNIAQTDTHGNWRSWVSYGRYTKLQLFFVFLLTFFFLPLRCLSARFVHANFYAKGPHIHPSSSLLLPPTRFFTDEGHPASIHIQNAWLEQGRILHLCWLFVQS